MQPPTAALIPGLPHPGSMRCRLHPQNRLSQDPDRIMGSCHHHPLVGSGMSARGASSTLGSGSAPRGGHRVAPAVSAVRGP